MAAYRTMARLVIKSTDEELPGVFGHGCVLLLEGVEREHSLNKAAKSMGMAYSKAWRIVKEAEAQLGCELLDRDGARGSSVTPAGKRAIDAYEELQGEIDRMLTDRAPALIAGITEPAN